MNVYERMLDSQTLFTWKEGRACCFIEEKVILNTPTVIK